MKLKRLFETFRMCKGCRKYYKIAWGFRFEVDPDYEFYFLPTISAQPWPFRLTGMSVIRISWLHVHIGIGVWTEKDCVDVYCGALQDTVVRLLARIVEDIALEIPCLECGGSGVWDYMYPEVPASMCISCKGTGKQYLGL